MSFSALFKSKLQPKSLKIKSEKKAEIILSDGRFAQIFNLKLGHLVASEDSNQLMQMAKIISMCVEIDDNPLSLEEVLNFSVRDLEKIVEQLVKT